MRRRIGALTWATLVVGAGAIRSQEPGPTGKSADGVTYQRLLGAAQEPESWLTYSGQYNGQRFSRLDKIHDRNVGNLKVKWVRQFKSFEKFETTPLVVDGMMYGTVARNEVFAMDPRTGVRYWTYRHPLPDGLRVCCGQVNRGVAMLGDTLYMGTLDARLVALDSKSGHVRWDVKVADYETGYAITSPPLAVKDMVITGIAGGEYGIRGFLDAYDAKTGERRWRTYTIPGSGEPGHESWEGDSWKTGGSPTWVTGTFDPQLNLLYWGTGNPGPDWNGDVRRGDNLYSDCVLAFDVDTGEIKWHFQFTPHDVHDWDATQVPVLVDAVIDGKPRKLLVTGNRNAFYYVLDRVSGEFLAAKAYAKQTWAKSIDKNGRPIRAPNTFPSKEGTLVSPDVIGATNWYSPTYSPKTQLFYITAFDGGGKYFVANDEYRPGEQFLGGFATFTGGSGSFPDPSYMSAVRALDATTGERKWEFRIHPRSGTGLLATAGNLVFGGTGQGYFFALNATTGQELWRLDIGGRVYAAPITYLVDGEQQVTIAAGNALFTFGF